METSLLLQNVLTPPVLFFFLGIFAIVVKSDLEIPAPLPKLFSLYLLLAIGFRGGFELQEGLRIGHSVLPTVGAAILMSLAIPIICFSILRLKLDVFNSAAIAAAYGSISAVTFITAESFLKSQDIPFTGWMVAPLALMESPAIIVGLALVKLAAPKNRPKKMKWRKILHESMLNGSVYLLVGSLIIGFLTAAYNPMGLEKIKPFTQSYLFYGVECFFLLDMGIVAAQRLPGLKKAGSFLILFSIVIPVINAIIGILVAKGLFQGTEYAQGNALLFAVLCASASYLAVPTAMRMTVPEAKASYYISTTLGLTFPFNIVIGIPIYMNIVKNIIPFAA